MEPLDTEAQGRAIDAVLVSGLICAGLTGAALLVTYFTQGVPDGALLANLRLGVYGLVILAGVIHSALQLHYRMRFMWGRGQWVVLGSPYWGEHEKFFIATFFVALAFGAVALLLALVGQFLP